MSGARVNSDGDAESASGSSGNELSERKRKENTRIGLPRSPFAKIGAVDEDVEEEGGGVGATKKQEAWEEDGTDEKASGKPGGEDEGVDEDAKAEGETVSTEDGQKGRRDEEKSAAVDGKRTEKEEEEVRRNEERERAMKEERWAEERMNEICEEEEVAGRVRAAAEEMAEKEGWAAFEEKRTGEGRKETIDLREVTVTWGKGLAEVEKTGEKKREEETWRKKREAAARVSS
jgi:hypothetical protein